MVEKSDFGKEVAKEYIDYQKMVQNRPLKNSTVEPGQAGPSIDREVKEQIISDIDRLIEKHGS